MILQFITALVLFIGIDYIWLSFLSGDLYTNGLKPLLRLTADGKIAPVLWAVILVYVFMALGVLNFVIPKVQSMVNFVNLDTVTKVIYAALWGALFGFIVYAVYDFTNYGIMTNYTLKVALIDVAWGTVLSGIVSGLLVLIF